MHVDARAFPVRVRNKQKPREPLLAGIRARLALLLLVASLPALIVFGSYSAYRFQQEKEVAIQRLQQQAQSIASTRGPLLDQTEALLRSLAKLPQLRAMNTDPKACANVLATAWRGSVQYANIAAVDMEGRVICRGVPTATEETVSVVDRAWFQRVVARRDFVIGNYAIGRGSGEPSIHTAFPITDEKGRMIGAINAGIRLSWLQERFAALNLPNGFVVALVDSDANILLRQPHPENFVGKKIFEVQRLIVEHGRGVAEVQMLDGVRRTMAYEPLGEMRWKDVTVVVAVDPSYLWDPVRRLFGLQLINFAIVLALSVLAAVIGAYWMVVRPVRRLERSVDAYADGDHSVLPDPGFMKYGEIGHLARAFNEMAEIRNCQEAALRKANARKSLYLAIASHDLRQPLQAMMIYMELALANAPGNVRAHIVQAQRAAARLRTQLDFLKDIVRADLSDENARRRIRPVGVADLFERIREAHQPSAAAKGVRLEIVSSRLMVASEPDALFTILNNLVMNAINYTQEGRVLVGCRRSGRMCRLEVHDTGPGIPPASRERIFEAFHRLEPEAGSGLGLGLTIVKETASLLGHALSVHSRLGKGSRFCVEVPIWDERTHNKPESRHEDETGARAAT